MRPVITPAEAVRLDQSANESVDVLMERAGRAIALEAVLMGAGYGTRVVVLAGPGNNGGDGYVAARLLRQRGVAVEVQALGDPKTRWSITAMGRAHDWGVPIHPIGEARPADLLVDALFGGGFRKGVPDVVRSWMASPLTVLAVDVPSGLDPTTGEVDGWAFSAARTMTFGALRTGHILGEGPDRCGVVNVADIGLPEGNAELHVTDEIDATRPARPRTAHKWSAGSVLVVGGSPGMTGAAILAGRAALNFGAGAVGLAVPDSAAATANASAPELLHYPIDDLPTRYQVLVIGPGLGLEQTDLVAKLIADWSGPMVIDADALAALDSRRPLPNRSAVLTPHSGEFERLAGVASSYQAARALAEALEATVLLKGNPTFVTDGTTPWVIDTGGPELATIGTGDVLSGMLGALLAGGLSPLEAARSAAYWHGRAGADLASRRTVTATALAEHVASIR